MNDEILEKVIKVAKQHFKKYKEEFTSDTHIIEHLGGDSLDAMEIVMLIEDEFHIILPEEKLEGVRTMGGLAKLVSEIVK
jgi:acyl carrier protein